MHRSMLRFRSSLASEVFRLRERSFQLVRSKLSSCRNYAAKDNELKQSPKDSNVIEECFLTSFMQHIRNPTFDSYKYLKFDIFGAGFSFKYYWIMLQAMCFGGRKAVDQIHQYEHMSHVLSSALTAVIEHISSINRRVSKFEEISQVGRIAANGDEKIGELVAKAFEKVGKDGCFIFSDEHEDNELEFFNQMTLRWRPISFIAHQKKIKIVLKNPLVLISEDTVSDRNVVDQAIKLGRPLVMVVEDVEDKVMGSLFLDKSLQIKVYVVKPSKFQENRKAIMRDLAIFTGGQVLNKMSDFNFIPQMLGSCKEVTIHNTHMIILGGSECQAAIKERCEQLKSKIKLRTSIDEVELLEKRLKELSYCTAVIKVKRESQAQARKALEVVKVAVEKGIIPGAGVALVHASKELDKLLTPEKPDKLRPRVQGLKITVDLWKHSDEKIAIKLFQNALKAPAYAIAAEAGFDGSFVVKKILEQNNPELGYDPVRGEYVDVIKSGVYDLQPNVEEELECVKREFLRGCWAYYYPDLVEMPGFLPVPPFHTDQVEDL